MLNLIGRQILCFVNGKRPALQLRLLLQLLGTEANLLLRNAKLLEAGGLLFRELGPKLLLLLVLGRGELLLLDL